MTCIVGLVDGKDVWLGGDRAATDGSLDRTLIKHPKIFEKSGIGVGICGLPKVIDAVWHAIDYPEHPEGMPTKTYLVSKFIPALRDGLKKFDCTVQHEGQHYFHGAMLIAYQGELHQLEGNFQLVESSAQFDAVGSGAPQAMGSFRSTVDKGNPKGRILAALKMSAKHNAGVAPPFDVLCIKG